MPPIRPIPGMPGISFLLTGVGSIVIADETRVNHHNLLKKRRQRNGKWLLGEWTFSLTILSTNYPTETGSQDSLPKYFH